MTYRDKDKLVEKDVPVVRVVRGSIAVGCNNVGSTFYVRSPQGVSEYSDYEMMRIFNISEEDLDYIFEVLNSWNIIQL